MGVMYSGKRTFHHTSVPGAVGPVNKVGLSFAGLEVARKLDK